MPLCPTASTPPTVAPSPVGQRDALALLGERGVELGDGRARAARTVISSARDPLDRRTALRPGACPDRARRRRPTACARRRPRPGPRRRPPRRTREIDRSLGDAHTQRARRGCSAGRRNASPPGSTFCGLATPSGSNASRSRACASRSSGLNSMRHEVALLDADAVLARQHAAGRDATPRRSPRPRRAPAPARRARAGRTTSSGWRLPSPAWNTFITIRS